jgi:arginase family enzyme
MKGCAATRVALAQRWPPTPSAAQFYKLTNLGLTEIRIFDLGNTCTEGTLEEIHAGHQTLVQQVISDGKRLIVLGGGMTSLTLMLPGWRKLCLIVGLEH